MRESGDTERSRIRALLTDKDSKLTAMDISLIRGNKTEVEPDGTISLYIGNLTGFQDPALYHIRSDGTIEMLEPLKMAGGGTPNNGGGSVTAADKTQIPAATVTTPRTGDDFSYTYILLFAAAAAMMTACACRIRKARR